jgi:hypothetical protein
MHFHGLILNIKLKIEFYNNIKYFHVSWFFLLYLQKNLFWGVDQTWKLGKLKKS